MRSTTILIAVAFVFFWNSGFIGAEYGLPYVEPYTFLFWRYCGVTLVIMLYLLARNRLRWVGTGVAMSNGIVGVLAHGIWLGCVLLALHHGVPAGIVALVVALQPLATGALSGVVTGEPTPLYRWIGLVIGFTGVAVTVTARMDFSSTESMFGYLIPFGSALSMTAATLIQRRLEIKDRTYRLPVDLSLFYQGLATMLVLAVPAVLCEGLSTRWEMPFIWTMGWLVVAVSLGAYALMWMLISRMDATRVASLFYLGPPVTMLMAWAAFGDTLQIYDVIGLVIVLSGVILTYSRLPGRSIYKNKF